MKKILLILGIIVLIGAVSIGVFIATFDANSFKPLVSEKLGDALGSRVEIGDLSLVFRGGIALAVDSLAIYEHDNLTQAPDLSLKSAYASLKIVPLLKKDIQVASVMLMKPKIQITRDKNGVIKVRGVNPPPASQDEKLKDSTPQTQKAAPAVSFLIGSIQITDGEARYQDEMLQPPVDVTVRDLDVTLKNVSMVKPIAFEALMAVFAEKQNISLKGTISGLEQNAPALKGFTASADLGSFQYVELARSIPALRDAGLEEGLAGNVSLSIPSMRIGADGIEEMSANIRLSDGRVAVSQIKAPVEKIQIAASYNHPNAAIDTFSASLAGASLDASGTVTDVANAQDADLKIKANMPKLNAFIQSLTGSAPKIDGSLSISLDGAATGLDWPRMSQTLSGAGTMKLQNGVILDTNIMREVLQKITFIPGLAAIVEEKLPASVKAKLREDYTLLQPIEKNFSIQNGTIALDGLTIETDLFSLNADAKATLAGEINGRGIIRFNKMVSEAMVNGFSQLSSLQDPEKMVSFPVVFGISKNATSFMPDLQFIAQKLAAEKGKELLGDLLKKAQKDGEGEGGEEGESSQRPSLFDQLLKEALGRSDKSQ
ncbi:MAG: AsmA family protein [Candidatus Omnitrophota bacterium]